MKARLPLVAVFVGTDHHRFDRLMTWIAALQSQGHYRFHVQHGATPLPHGLAGEPMMDVAAMTDLLNRADAVVTHGGPGSIMDARQQGHVPVVVPRSPRLGEHVDDHQQRFVRFLAPSGLILAATDEAELAVAIATGVALRGRTGQVEDGAAAVARFESLVDQLVTR